MNIRHAAPLWWIPAVLVAPWVTPAQAQDSTAARELSPVVVTATGSAIDLKDAPASISVITREEIERKPVQSLGSLLSTVPGVTGGLGTSGEQSKIKLRGLPENYTLILVDGRRVGRSADTNYRPDLGRQDLDWISSDMIERIEVVRGPMSSLYGSDAMGGVINIITRKIARTWGGSVTTNYTRPQNSDRGDAYQLGFNISGPLTDSLGIRVGGQVSRSNPDDVNDDNGGTGGWRNESVNALLNWRVAPGHDLSFEVTSGVQRSLASSKTRTTAAGATTPVNAAWGATKLSRTNYVLSHDGDWGVGKSKLTFYHNAYRNGMDGDVAKSSDSVLEGSLNLPYTLGVDHALTIGGQWKRESLENSQTIGTVPVDYDGQVVSGSRLKGSTWAMFLENESFLTDKLTLTLGARLDHHSKFGNHVSPRAYVVYHPTEDWTLRGGISRGFRAPTLKENTAGAATQSRGNGCNGLIPMGYRTGGCYMAGNADLQPETSTNVEFGVGYARNGYDLGLTYFHTNFKNKIDYAPLGYYQGRWWTKMTNAQRARTRGLEGSAVIPLTEGVRWRTTFTWMMEAKNLSTGAQLLSTPKLTVNTALNWQINERLQTDLSAQYVGKQLGGGTTFVKAYTTLDWTGHYAVNKNLTVRAGIENLFNKQLQADGATNFYSPGRRFFVGATARF